MLFFGIISSTPPQLVRACLGTISVSWNDEEKRNAEGETDPNESRSQSPIFAEEILEDWLHSQYWLRVADANSKANERWRLADFAKRSLWINDIVIPPPELLS